MNMIGNNTWCDKKFLECFQILMQLPYNFEQYNDMHIDQFVIQKKENQHHFCSDVLTMSTSNIPRINRKQRVKLLSYHNTRDDTTGVIQSAYETVCEDLDSKQKRLELLESIFPGLKQKIKNLKEQKSQLDDQILEELVDETVLEAMFK
jgi:hypothetical protein